MSRRFRTHATTLDQLDLFSAAGSMLIADRGQAARSTAGPDPAISVDRQRPQVRQSISPGKATAQVAGQVRPMPGVLTRRSEPPVRILAVEDMPQYPADLVAAAKRSIKDAPTDRVLLTYKEIDGFFGISRATVARRLKEGVVPGIRIRSGRVLEDGPVRRLDRTQVLYLLLAVRARRR